ncbi:hypothetical protein BDV12DRAFT_196697 [Aspergillus spectabilis]
MSLGTPARVSVILPVQVASRAETRLEAFSRNSATAFLVFDGVDVLDFAGPLEIFSHVHYGMGYTSPNPAFELTTIDRPTIISTSAAVKLHPDITIADTRSRLNDFDILVVPGGPRLSSTHSLKATRKKYN